MNSFYHLLKYVFVLLIVAIVIAKAYAMQNREITTIDEMDLQLSVLKKSIVPKSTIGFYSNVQPADSALRMYYRTQFLLVPNMVVAAQKDTMLLVVDKEATTTGFEAYNVLYSNQVNNVRYLLVIKK